MKINVTTHLPMSVLYLEDVKFIMCDPDGVAVYEGEMSDAIVKHWQVLGYQCKPATEK